MSLAALLPALVFVAGVGQLVLIVASLAIPRVLRWREDTAKLRPLTRQVFWAYAAYIWGAHIAFGLLSALAPRLLVDGSSLAGLACAFIALWWGARLALQFLAFDRGARPPGAVFVAAEVALVSGFAAFAGIYAIAAWRNLAG